MKSGKILFWSVAFLFLMLIYGTGAQNLMSALIVVGLMVIMALVISNLFNNKIVPAYLESGNTAKFTLHSLYLLIFMLWLQMLVMTLLFITLAQYNYENMPSNTTDVVKVALTVVVVVALEGFYLTMKRFKSQQSQLERDKKKFLVVKSERKDVPVDLEKLAWVESLGDFVKIHADDVIITREKISSLEKKLPSNFLRIHRSFIVNTNLVSRKSTQSVKIGDSDFPIGRTYKEAVKAYLS